MGFKLHRSCDWLLLISITLLCATTGQPQSTSTSSKDKSTSAAATTGDGSGSGISKSISESEAYVKQYFTKIAPKILQHCQSVSHSTWALHLNPSAKEVQDKNTNAQLAYDEFLQQIKSELTKYTWRNFNDLQLRRQIERIIYDTLPLPSDKAKTFLELAQAVETKKEQLKGQILDDPENVIDERLSPKAYFNKMFQKNKQDWKKYYNGLGKEFKAGFPTFLQLSKEYLKNSYVTSGVTVRESGHSSSSSSSSSSSPTKLLYNEIQVELKNVETIWENELAQFYEQLHAYTRGTLRLLYGRHIPKSDQLIPISTIGKLENWLDVYSDSVPFESSPSRDDITEALQVKLNVSTMDLFREVEEFYISINLPAMQPKFWTDSIFEKGDEQEELVCDTTSNSLQPFCYQNDSRLIECDGVNFYTLNKAYTSLGMAKLYMLTKNMDYLPVPELDEVVTDALNFVWLLYGSSPERFRRMYLLEPSNPSPMMNGKIPPTLSRDAENKRKKRVGEINTNFQHFQALHVLPELANVLSTQQWFWSVYNGNGSEPKNYNCEYWKFRAELEGVQPPIRRNKNHFDPFQLISTSTYRNVGKFISYVMAFQIHKSLCITAGEYEEVEEEAEVEGGGFGPAAGGSRKSFRATPPPTTTTQKPKYLKYPKLPNEKRSSFRSDLLNQQPRKTLRSCDITDSKAVGKQLKKLANSGALADWRATLKFLTGSEQLSTSPMMEYFKPYYNWLVEFNKKSRFPLGWKVPKGKNNISC